MTSPDRGRRADRAGDRDADEQPLDTRDPMGRMALFSSTEPEPAGPKRGLMVTCSSCLAETRVSPADLAKAALPFSVHLPFVRRYHSFIRCPACGRRAWMRVTYVG